MYIPPKTYIAGPFFNPPQIELIQNIELVLIDNGIPVVSPRLQKDNAPKKAGGITPEMAQRIFDRNIDDIMECPLMIAVLDWKMKPGCDLRVVQHSGVPYGTSPFSPPLNLPDSGTVFEMGFAYAYEKFGLQGPSLKIVGFTERDPNSALNVMLTQSCRGVIHGLDNLKLFTKNARLNWDFAPEWKGRNQ